ncbi:putative plastid-lipid-associated protein 4, chloroplastic [Porphyridium purpureum]|uniref:Putative plastid-lipid-associated protein 4, chloroplastic n=1 Tax=Porphyridium purpureum TaxID=35688 RepID=A0A5J4YRL2_PORPP|nr:putative plastid-lipid-associated protein 4, chloroplastic [Porphyridium purpureum]|eukprot:POR5267..scf229_5
MESIRCVAFAGSSWTTGTVRLHGASSRAACSNWSGVGKGAVVRAAGGTRLVAVFAGGQSAKKDPKVEQAKQELLGLLKKARLGRAVANDEALRAEYNSAIANVERLNSSKEPVYDRNLSVRWRLVYTDSQSILGTKRPPIARPNDDIFQTIDASKAQVVNEETTMLFGVLPAKVAVRASLEIKSSTRVNVKFEEFSFLGFLKVKAPDTFRGWLETTYLDESLRISRGNLGNVFVLIKE